MLKTRFYSSLGLTAITILVVLGPRFGGILFASALLIASLYELHKMIVPFNAFIFAAYALLIALSCSGIVWMKWQLWPGEMWLLLTFLITWAHDTGGYVFGKIFQGAKIWPSVSPNKTWSGLIGGIILGFFVTWVCGLYSDSGMPTVGLLTLVMLNLLGLGGDLIESKIKRLYNHKDSGSLIPGHGGILDRFDSFFTINLVMWVLYWW